MKCPICGKDEIVCVGPWRCGGSYGLGFNRADGKTCCSMHHPHPTMTEDEAQKLADSKSLQEWANDEDLGWQEWGDDLIGLQDDGDPNDREPLSF